MPADWLIAHLVQTGAHNPDGIGRLLRLRRCGSCGADVLQGLDDDRCALVATTDPHDIDTNGEAVALILGLQTYSIMRAANSNRIGWSLNPRYPANVAAGVRGPVVAQHRCGIAVPPATRPPAAVRHRTDQPPF